jgi:hypothetical protein
MADRTCPYCKERVKREAIVCKHCGRDLPVYSRQQAQADRTTNSIGCLILIVVVFVIGIAGYGISHLIPHLESSSYLSRFIRDCEFSGHPAPDSPAAGYGFSCFDLPAEVARLCKDQDWQECHDDRVNKWRVSP